MASFRSRRSSLPPKPTTATASPCRASTPTRASLRSSAGSGTVFHGISSLILLFYSLPTSSASSTSSDNSPAVGASAPPATTAADAATVPLPVDVAATEDIIVFAAATKNGTIQLNNSSYSFLKSDASKMIHAAERLGTGIETDGITTLVLNTSAYFFKKTVDLIDFKENRQVSYEYKRYENPTTVLLEEKISILEGAESTVILASGIFNIRRLTSLMLTSVIFKKTDVVIIIY
ncbi:hypothetical protein JHK82_012647 [Glycine max]|uniref:Uncharacterized protein n=2 Tax=Glycine subgen. Soja TaxID=1462606 RepID=K7KPM4_SOYBN|nr:hypothetical protein JHK85_013000 [Glycine max]KAG5057670.1 hypothetical protein JHK86_012666 [Glycine max]KAG5154678.1 hypothetical protein JHK82_012647 [Glycine max]KAH1133881.1 hypothetical protein GYH30_012336 [Glycine max]RZC12014.1 Cystathionine gamma-synthase 1, chloroplastic [Glycine soja]